MKNFKQATVAPGIFSGMRRVFLLLLCAFVSMGWAQTAEERERFEKLAAQGGAEAEFNLGVIYENGQGVAKDERKAFEWYEKAAAQGLAKAQFNLASMYSRGLGVAKDERKAAEWVGKAAAQGDAYAQFVLGSI